MRNRRNIILITSVILAAFCCCLDNSAKARQPKLIYMSNQDITKKDTFDINSIINMCDVEYTVGEFAHIKKYRLIVNDTVVVFQIQNLYEYLNEKYTQVTLNMKTMTRLKELIYVIYSNNSSILKSGMPNYKEIDYWYAKVGIDDRIIEDKVGISKNVDYGERPTVSTFNELVKIFYDIGLRMEYDFYDFNYRGNMTIELEKNMQNGDFYDPESVIHGNL